MPPYLQSAVRIDYPLSMDIGVEYQLSMDIEKNRNRISRMNGHRNRLSMNIRMHMYIRILNGCSEYQNVKILQYEYQKVRI